MDNIFDVFDIGITFFELVFWRYETNQRMTTLIFFSNFGSYKTFQDVLDKQTCLSVAKYLIYALSFIIQNFNKTSYVATGKGMLFFKEISRQKLKNNIKKLCLGHSWRQLNYWLNLNLRNWKLSSTFRKHEVFQKSFLYLLVFEILNF